MTINDCANRGNLSSKEYGNPVLSRLRPFKRMEEIMENEIVTIYKITNKDTGKIYIGQTTVPKDRLAQHFKTAKQVAWGHQKSYNGIYDDIIELGEDSFVFEEIDKCSYRHRFIIEEFWIVEYERKGFNLYNLNKGSKQCDHQKELASRIEREKQTYFQTEEFKDKMSTVTSGEKNGMFGKTIENAVNGQEVFMKNEKGEIIETFVSVRHALEYLGLKGHVKLFEACREGTPYKGYYWSKTWSNR